MSSDPQSRNPAPGSGPSVPAADRDDTADRCPACGSTEARGLFAASDDLCKTCDEVFEIVECSQCRLIRLSPQPDPGDLPRYYPEGYWDGPEATITDRLELWYRQAVLSDSVYFTQRALKECQEPGLVLDVGCGAGLFLEMLASRARRRVIGLDFSLDAAIAASARGVPAICGSLVDAPFPKNSCAAVTMFNVLEHLYDPVAYLESAHELLAGNGRLIVQVPNAASWQFLLLGERWAGLDTPRHLVHFRLADLKTLLDNCGFEILRVKHFSLRENPSLLASSLVPFLDPSLRRLRKVAETAHVRLAKDFLYLLAVLACLPFALVEAACRAGATVMLEARKKRV